MSALVEQSDVDRVRDAIDLVALIGEHIPLKARGREHVGLCPFHEDRTPSLTVVTHKGNAFYKCHACGAAGDAFNFVMDYHKMPFPEALTFLAERAGITLRRADTTRRGDGAGRDELRHANAFAAEHYRRTLLEDRRTAPARAMVAARGIAAETAEQFMIGAAVPAWDDLLQAATRQGLTAASLSSAGLAKARTSGPGHYDTFRNRLIFPICDELGRPIAFGGRRIDPDDEPKYLNSPESPAFHKSRTLYALHLAKRSILDARQAIVTEGYTDVVACHQAGVRNVVATLGTALTPDHVRVLKRLCEEIVLVFDGDEAGQRAADRAVELVFAEPVDVRICVLPGGADPADLLARPQGGELLRAAIEAATDALSFKVRRFRDELAAARGPAGRQRSLTRLLESLGALGFHGLSGVRKRPVVAQLAQLLDVRMDDIESAMPRPVRGTRGPAAPPAAPAPRADELFAAEADVPKRRRRAERDLLGLILLRPDLCREPLCGVLRPSDFADAAARRLAEALWPRLDGGEAFTVQQLMTELDSPAARGLAGELFIEAQRRVGNEPVLEHLAAHLAAIEQLANRDRYHRDLEALRRQGGDGDALRRAIEARREQGYIPEALPARIRT